MTPVYQTKCGAPHGNCFAACVATLLDRKIEEVDVDVASCEDVPALIDKIEHKAKCRIYIVSHEAFEDRIVRTSERYCFAEVYTCVLNGSPSDPHAVVCEIRDDGIALVFNPDQDDPRRSSVKQFASMGRVFFVKANPAFWQGKLSK